MDAGQTALVRDLIKSNQEYVRKYEELRHSITYTQSSDTQTPVLDFNVQNNLHFTTNGANVESNVKAETDSSHIHHFVSLFDRLQTEINMPSYQIGSRSRSRIQKHISNAHDSEIKHLLRAHGELVSRMIGRAALNENTYQARSKSRAQNDGSVKLAFTKQTRSTNVVTESASNFYDSVPTPHFLPPRIPDPRPYLPKSGSASWHPWFLSPLVIPQGSLPVSKTFLSAHDRDSEVDDPSQEVLMTLEASVESRIEIEAHDSPALRNKKISQTGLAGAPVARLAERARSKSRNPQKERERSKSQDPQGLPIAAAGLGTAAIASLYERHQYKNERQNEEKAKAVLEERMKPRRRGRSRSRSVPFEGYREVDSCLIDYGDQPVYIAGSQGHFTPEKTLPLRAKTPTQELRTEAEQKHLNLQDPMRHESLSPAAAKNVALGEHWPPLFTDLTEDTRPEVSSSTIPPEEVDSTLHIDAPAMPRSTRPSPAQTSSPTSNVPEGLNKLLPDSGTSLSDTVTMKRARNTIAARKSRQKRMEHMKKLEEEVSRLSIEMEMWKNRATGRSHVTSDGQVIQDYGKDVYNEGDIEKDSIPDNRSDRADDDGIAASQYQASDQAGDKELAELLELWTMGYKYAQTQKGD